MMFPSNYHSIDNPLKIIYEISMKMVYGDGTPIPQYSSLTLDVDCYTIRLVIEEFMP
jgi:hypothetical protein